MKKSIYYFTLFFTLLLVGCQSDKTALDLLTLVPSKTAVVLKTNDFSKLAQKLEGNSFVSKNMNLPIVKFFKSGYEPLSRLDLSGNSLLCFSKVGRDELATTLITEINPKLLDSIGYTKIEGYKYNGQQIKKYRFSKKIIYGAKLKGFFVFGDSKLVVENMVRLSNENIQPNPKLKKVFKTSSNKTISLYINPPEFHKIYSRLMSNGSTGFLPNFSDWVTLDIDIKDNGIHANGIAIPEKDEALGLFKNTEPRKNEMATITPFSAAGFYSFTYDDYESLKDNLSFYRKKDYPTLSIDLLTTASEVGEIYVGLTPVLALKSTQPEKTEKVLSAQGKLVETHRNHKIYSFAQSDYFFKALQPLVKLHEFKYYVRIHRFFVFSRKLSALEGVIANVQNKTVLSEAKTYQEASKQLSDKSSLLVVGISKSVLKSVTEMVQEKYKEDYHNTDLLNYNYAALQFINNKNFTYVNGVFSEARGEAGKSHRGGVQLGSIKPGEKLATAPWFFINWRTREYDIAMQGKSDTLYMYDSSGNLRWKKKLDGPIVGDIQPIDIYHNKRIQLAFVTPHTFYIIDRDGKIVKPFDQKFDQPITQPLAIFDYNNNGKFRFLITQGKHLTMLDKQLKPVKGFEFHSAKSEIIAKPRHFRIGSKDYIVFPEQSGKLHILNLRGQTRIQVKQNIDFSDNSWYLYHDHFTSTNKKGELIQIDQNGGLTKKNLKLNEHNRMYATAKTLVTFSENKLTIKGKTIDLDYGLYTTPKIFYIKDKLYISITDTQSHKVYLFDSSANLFSGFPVYGNSTVDLKNMDSRGSVALLVQGEDDSVLIYQVQY